ncbi:uncharacterized protein PGTG_05906 [Puccinia graminis f. sp. tritici CRL 75-36-700-3]|uniref:Uncharacterized protein n=1 Tax=Puccinia graminis f. sp. tritici (strain CRL 75-36-700-3 / race SCCL) TaxID=418459 RepID=E3K614_PUCGT|nr:uncharacterized protein PGTG_05906 [Puccinia graminis f. sp. tritici CRL 75-36-700-3]EFP79585.2 hypothetical protein PGTG_05906 [Puccinia graminis f. sp. tritici CRL 75-36-700-3]
MTPPGQCSDEPVQRLAGRPCPRAARTNPCKGSSDRPVQPVSLDSVTYSRLAYDRLPIAVDRVFNKALALLHLRQRRSAERPWALRSSLEDNRLKHPFPSELADDLDPTLLSQLSLSPAIGPAEPLDPPAIFVTVECPESAASWQIRPDLFGLMSHSEDGLSESTSLSSSQEPPTMPVISHTAPLIQWSCKLRKIMGAEMDQSCRMWLSQLGCSVASYRGYVTSS